MYTKLPLCSHCSAARVRVAQHGPHQAQCCCENTYLKRLARGISTCSTLLGTSAEDSRSKNERRRRRLIDISATLSLGRDEADDSDGRHLSAPEPAEAEANVIMPPRGKGPVQMIVTDTSAATGVYSRRTITGVSRPTHPRASCRAVRL